MKNNVAVGHEIVPLGTGKYTDIQKFDARVFACSAALAKCTDIINRKVLEPSFEAVMDAGKNRNGDFSHIFQISSDTEYVMV